MNNGCTYLAMQCGCILIYSHTHILYICSCSALSRTWGPVLWSEFWTEENFPIKHEKRLSVEYNAWNLSLFFIFLPFSLYKSGSYGASMMDVLYCFLFSRSHSLDEKIELTCPCLPIQDGTTTCKISFRLIILSLAVTATMTRQFLPL